MKRALLSAVLLCAAAFAAAQVNWRRIDGAPPLPERPAQIAVYPLGILDTVMALGVRPAAVPENVPLRYLDVSGIATAGGVFSPDLEKLHAIAPEFIIVGSRSAGSLAQVSKIAPAVDISLERGNSYRSGIAVMQQLAALLGHESEAQDIEARLHTLLAQAKSKAPRGETALFVVILGRQLHVLNAQSRVGWIAQELELTLANGDEPPSNDPKQHAFGVPISFEYIAEKRPDWLFVFDRDGGLSDKQDNSALLDTPLIHNNVGRVVHMDAQTALNAIGGVQALEITLKQLIKTFEQHHDKLP